MIGYVTLGSNDIEASAEFYDQLFSEIGINRLWSLETFVAWGVDSESPMFSITTPFNKERATVGNGVMIAIKVPNTQTVDLIHKKALDLGAVDEGAPGPRGAGYYSGYFRDLDGNKLNFYLVTKQST
ncbi:MAG: VOC family protein [Arenicella sp.]